MNLNKLYKRILVTGGCGFLGRELVPLLIQNDYEVVVADDLSNPQSEVQTGYKFYQVDVGNKNETQKAFEGIDACIALASRRGSIGHVHRHPTDVIANNNKIFNGTFELAASAKVKIIIFLSDE